MSIHLSETLGKRLLSDREHLHRFPELSFREYATSQYLQRRASEIGATVVPVTETGFVAVLVNGDGPTVAYRADLDALPIREETGLDYASRETASLEGETVGVMHACGHDVHMTIALGLLEYLATHRAHWRGTVEVIFQPAEELGAGAKAMLAEGIWEKVAIPEVVFGLHVMPLQAGQVQIPVGPAMAYADSWRVTISGQGSHASQPQSARDPIIIGASIVMRLQTIVAREVDPRQAVVVSVASFRAGMKENIIPDTCELKINIRTLDAEVRRKVLDAIRRIIRYEALAGGVQEPVIDEISRFPLCYNDPRESERVITVLSDALGASNVGAGSATMISEDFGLLAAAVNVPSVFWFLGGFEQFDAVSSESLPMNHTSSFAPVSEPTITAGVKSAVAAVFDRLAV